MSSKDIPQLPTVDAIKSVLSTLDNQSRYAHFRSPMIDAQFRLSIVPRRTTGQLDIDITQIAVPEGYQKKGIATQFFKMVVSASQELGRGVFVENCITEASQKWRARLIALHLADGYTVYHALSKGSESGESGGGGRRSVFIDIPTETMSGKRPVTTPSQAQ